ncbi:MAG TPA: SRPBCC family protein [Solirubrobacteraceae bacterium]|nr:SRPBCC family protein [Solirubrobacteraceae bacterium]
MRFQNEIEVKAPPDELFAFVSDVERVAPCLPGAAIEGRDGDEYQGSMKVKVGPITGTYKGKMRFVERDEQARRAVMSARAAEINGQGDAEARITTQIEEAGEGSSRIRMDTDLQIRGRVAQFGRGAMEKISQRMFDEFARNLEREMTGGGRVDGAQATAPDAAAEAPEAAQDAEARPTPQRPTPPAGDGEALDVMGIFVSPVLQKALPVLGPAIVGFGYGYLLGRLRELRR